MGSTNSKTKSATTTKKQTTTTNNNITIDNMAPIASTLALGAGYVFGFRKIERI